MLKIIDYQGNLEAVATKLLICVVMKLYLSIV